MAGNRSSEQKTAPLAGMIFIQSRDGFTAQSPAAQNSGHCDVDQDTPPIGHLQFSFDAEMGELSVKVQQMHGKEAVTTGIRLGKNMGPTEAIANVCAVQTAFQTLLQERYKAEDLNKLRPHGQAPNSNLIKSLFEESKLASIPKESNKPGTINEVLEFIKKDMDVREITATDVKKEGLDMNLAGTLCLTSKSGGNEKVYISSGENFSKEPVIRIDKVDPSGDGLVTSTFKQNDPAAFPAIIEHIAKETGLEANMVPRASAYTLGRTLRNEIYDAQDPSKCSAHSAAATLFGKEITQRMDSAAQVARGRREAHRISLQQTGQRLPTSGPH